MTNPQALTAAAKAIEPFFSAADIADGEHDEAARTAITAYLNALPPISEGIVEDLARALWFDHVDQHGYPNGLPTWDELPERIERRIDINTREHWRSIAQAAANTIQYLSAKLAEQGEGK